MYSYKKSIMQFFFFINCFIECWALLVLNFLSKTGPWRQRRFLMVFTLQLIFYLLLLVFAFPWCILHTVSTIWMAFHPKYFESFFGRSFLISATTQPNLKFDFSCLWLSLLFGLSIGKWSQGFIRQFSLTPHENIP